MAVGNDDDEGVRSGDRCNEAGGVGDIRMLGDRLVDGAEGGGGGGGSIHRRWAAELKDQLPPRRWVGAGGEESSSASCG
jgi:hypothetical protein